MCYPTPYYHFIEKLSNFIDFDLSYFINFHPYFNSYISFRKDFRKETHFSFKPYFCLMADNQGFIYFTITFLPFSILQNKIYYKTINYVISVIPNMIRSAVSAHSPKSYCSLHGFAAHSQRSLRQFEGECTANPRRLQYDSTETALRIEKFLNRLKNFCSLVTPLRMR